MAASGPLTRTESSPACSPRKSRRAWERIRAKSIANSLGTWAIRFTNASRLPPRRNKKPRSEDCRQPTFTLPKSPAKRSSRFSPTAPGDGNPIGGIKVIAKNGWFAARPSGTEEIYKIYAESFLGQDHLRRIQEEAQTIVSETLARSAASSSRQLSRTNVEKESLMSSPAYGRSSARMRPFRTLSRSWLWTCAGLSTTPRTRFGSGWIPNSGN